MRCRQLHPGPRTSQGPWGALAPISLRPVLRDEGRSSALLILPAGLHQPRGVPTAARSWQRVSGGAGAGPGSRGRGLQLPGGTAAAAATRHSRPRQRPREAARAGAGAGADREPGAEDGGRPNAPHVRRPRGAPPHSGAAAPRAPSHPPSSAVVARDAEPGTAGGAARGERCEEGWLPAVLALGSYPRAPAGFREPRGQVLLALCHLWGTGEPAALLPFRPAWTTESLETALPF